MLNKIQLQYKIGRNHHDMGDFFRLTPFTLEQNERYGVVN